MDIEISEKWRTIAANMPWFSLPPEYEIKMMPPFGLVSLRFGVRLRDNPDQECSVYLIANSFAELCWKIFPIGGYDGEWPLRFARDDTGGLVQGIIAAIADSNKEPLVAVEFKPEDDDE